MLKLSHKTLILISGAIWMLIGCFLLPLGVNFLVESTQNKQMVLKESYPIINHLAPYIGGIEETALILLFLSLYIGYLKGRYVLGKSARKGVDRIIAFPNPTSLGNIYSLRYYVLLICMILLGLSIKYMGLSLDIRGIVDVIIGSALIYGAAIYFRYAFARV